ncbi:MAG: SemiSWEET transporter [Chloroflexi bacterium]|nr:SemiSWEET transporter [Chloroflexota bacterium]
MPIWYLIGSVAALCTSFSYVPQIIRMWRTRSVRDISPVMLVQFSIGVALWLAYGVHLKDAIIIAANAVSLLAGVLATGLYVYYRKPPAAIS